MSETDNAASLGPGPQIQMLGHSIVANIAIIMSLLRALQNYVNSWRRLLFVGNSQSNAVALIAPCSLSCQALLNDLASQFHQHESANLSDKFGQSSFRARRWKLSTRWPKIQSVVSVHGPEGTDSRSVDITCGPSRSLMVLPAQSLLIRLPLGVEYVSPYPPLSPSTQSARRTSSAITSTRTIETNAPQSSSATSLVAGQENAENVREYTFLTSPVRMFQLPSFDTMLDASTITQVGSYSLFNSHLDTTTLSRIVLALSSAFISSLLSSRRYIQSYCRASDQMAPANRPEPKAQKQALITALKERRINTIGELRRVERIFATLGSSDVTQPMTGACVFYAF